MAAKNTRLTVFANLDDGWAPSGVLDLTEDGETLEASEFAYGLRYLERANAIEVDPVSLPIADKDAVRGKRLQPAAQLPFFGGIRDAAPDAWGRRVIEAKLKARTNSLAESVYLLHAGSDRVGALDVRETPTSAASPSLGPGLHQLSYLIESANRIEAGLPVPAELEAIFVGGSGLGGARPKATVRDADGVLWLAKFPSQGDRMAVPVIEAATLRLAGLCGIRVPPTRIEQVGARAVMLIRRFDRYWKRSGNSIDTDNAVSDDWLYAPPAGADERRLPFVSGLTLVGCSELDSATKSYMDLAQAIRTHGHAGRVRADNRELFKRMVFNIFVSNDDDHLRNHGFIRDPTLAGWRLSPLYDVLPRPSTSFERRLHLGVGPRGREATLDNAFESRDAFNVTRSDAAQAIAEVWEKVREWKAYFEASGVPGDEIEKVSAAFRHIDQIASKPLRKALS